MPRTWYHPRLIGVLLVVAFGPPAFATQSTDLTAAMPADTLIYVGWSQLLEEGSPDARIGRQLIAALAEQELDEEGAAVALLLQALIPIETGSCGIGLLGLTMEGQEPAVELALVVDAGRDTRKIAATLDRFIEMTGCADEVVRGDVNGVALQSLRLPDTPLHLYWGIHKGRFVLTISEPAAHKVIACMNGDAPTLADATELKFNRNKVDANLDGRFFCLYVDARRTLATAREVAGEIMGELPPMVDQVIDALGLNSVRSKYLHADWANDQMRLMGFQHVDGPMHGLLSLWLQQPLTDDDLKIVPKDAYWMQVNNLDLAKLWQEALRVAGRIDPEVPPMMERSVVEVAQMLGFSVADDLLPALGDTWAFFDAPDHGGILLSGTVLVVDVKDADAVHGVLSRTVEFLTPLLEEEDVVLHQKRTEHSGHTIHYVMIGGVPAPVAPAWGFVDERLVFGLYPQTVATAMRQVDPATRGASILDNADFRSTRAQLPDDALGIAYYDSKYFARLLYPFLNGLQTAGMSMLAEYGIELDLELMPPLPQRTAKVTNYVGTSSVDADGILYANVGDGAPLAMVAGGAAMGAAILVPSLRQAREQAKGAVSMSNLRGIGQACHIYANDHEDKFPDSLEQLIEEGTVTAEMLTSPLAPWETVAYEYVPGQTVADDPRNVLAYEKIHDDKGTNVLFLDGHVKFMKLDQFREALAQTYRRLGREDEIPAWPQ